jgi:glutathione S-transferase
MTTMTLSSDPNDELLKVLATNAWCGGPSLKPGRVGRGAFPFTGQPVLETADGTVWGAAAVCRYLALAAGKLDASALAVDQWLEWEDTRLAPLVRALSGANVSFPLPEPVRAPRRRWVKQKARA